MFKPVDSFLDNITMYRLALYYLIALLVAATGLAITGDLQYNALELIGSAMLLVAVCWITNKVFATFLKAPTNSESSLITALILALIITPAHSLFSFTFLLAAGGLAIASKYLLTINRKHLFNPAAIAVALTALGPRQTASWWVGTAVMAPFVLIGGVLLVRKLRRSKMVVSFFAASLIATAIYTLLGHGNVASSLDKAVLASPLLFLGFVMLTEPLTTPPTAKNQRWYGVLAGVLLPPQVHIFSLYSSPELALLISNVFAYIVSPKTNLFPVLKQKVRIAAHSVDFIFTPGQQLAYQPGQYMEWTLPHNGSDSRGVRRYFTLASSPTEPDIRIGVKFYDKGSSFKSALLKMDEATPIVAAQVNGDFVLPQDHGQKLAFIAGGIGITPFRSMIKYLLDTDDTRSVTLLYGVKNAQDIAYRELFEEARAKLGLGLSYYVANGQTANLGLHTQTGIISAETIKYEIPDYHERLFYISGTHQMVTAVQDALHSLGIPAHHTKIDFFPGYA